MTKDYRGRRRTDEELEESDETDDGCSVGDGGHGGSELSAAVVEHRSEEERDEEEHDEDRHVPHHRSERDDGDSEETRHLLVARHGEPEGERREREGQQAEAEEIEDGKGSVFDSRLDEEVRDGEDDCHADGSDDLGGEDDPPSCPGHVGRELLGRVSESLPLVPGDPRPREPAVSDPRVCVRPRVSSRHPPEELAVVDDKVRERELVWVEQERRDRQRQSGDPEVDEPVHPQRGRHVEHHQRESHAEVDRRSGESRVEDREVDPRRGESSTGGDVSCSSERQVGQDRVRVNLGREDLKDRRQRHEVLSESVHGPSGSTLRQFCSTKEDDSQRRLEEEI